MISTKINFFKLTYKHFESAVSLYFEPLLHCTKVIPLIKEFKTPSIKFKIYKILASILVILNAVAYFIAFCLFAYIVLLLTFSLLCLSFIILKTIDLSVLVTAFMFVFFPLTFTLFILSINDKQSA